MSERPFALRSTLYTAGFLVVILGVVPSVFHLAGKMPFRPSAWWTEAAWFWLEFRQLVGIAIFAIGLAMYLACSAWLIYFGRGPHVEFDPPRHFVATGPYRWMRNPVAASLIVTVAGQALYLGSVGIGVLVLLGLPIAHLQVKLLEEPKLRKRFGESYEQYCRTVPRWLPRPPATST